MAENAGNAPAAGDAPISASRFLRPGLTGRFARIGRYLLLIPALFVVAAGGHACTTHQALESEIEEAARDPETGVIVGTEALDLGPRDAPAACLLIHGFVGSRKDFADLGERLAEAGFFVRMMRLPGHGTTPREFARLEAEDLLDAAREETDALLRSHHRVYLVGFSMGGAISTVLTAERNTDLAGTVLVSPYFEVTYYPYYILPPMVWNAMLSPVAPYVIKGERFVRVNRRESVPHIFSYRVVPTRGARTLDRLGKRAGDPDTLSRITVPVLMIQAEGDEAASPKAGREAFDRIASTDKTHRLFSERSNHHLLWDYEAEEAKADILDFLGRLETSASGSVSLHSAVEDGPASSSGSQIP